MAPSWSGDPQEKAVHQWEASGHFLHYLPHVKAWECWAHEAPCDAVKDGKLQEAT